MTESRQPPQLRCEKCNRGAPELFQIEGDLWCESCIDNHNEAAYMRHQEHLMENGPGPTLAEQQAEARKLK